MSGRLKPRGINLLALLTRAPGTVTRHQEDEAAYISPKLYRDFMMPL